MLSRSGKISESGLEPLQTGSSRFSGIPGELILAVVPDDPSSNRYLECAVESEADGIVTGDRHLRVLVQYQGVGILSPREFAELPQVC
jgi:predicted nucleic acid-binding protein